ncbi:hypothetical protein CPC08DRAFT_638151, partial [Agrocybe pediades]
LKVNYECVIDTMRIRTDILHIHPHFHKRPRYDYVLLRISAQQHIFAQLLHVFSTRFEQETYHLALILPMDKNIPVLNRRRDTDLRFTRVRSRPRSEAIVINTTMIVRGALLAPAFGSDTNDEYIVMEVVDDDLWYRVRTDQIKLAYNVNLNN